MSKPVVLVNDGKLTGLEGTVDGQVLKWNASLSQWEAGTSSGGSGTVTSVGLTGGTSGLVIGGTASPITSSGTFDIDAPHRFAFDTVAPVAPTSPGQISWNATEGSLNTLMVGGNVDAIVGQQLYQRVVNADSVTLTKGMVVYVYGSSGTRASVKRATADADLSSATILGVVAESIAVNGEGFIITNGLLSNLSVLPSTTFVDGDVVYLSPTTPGGLTKTKPTAPNHLVLVGYCVKASNGAAGVLLVHPQNGYELDELHDVYINNPTSGQILVYDATIGQTRWENASLTGGTGVTVTPGAGSLSVSIGQSVATSASPTFAGLTLTSFSGLVRATAGVLAGGATVALATEVSGTLPIANGGTNNGSLSVTAGTVYYGDGTKLVGLAPGTSGQVLQSQGSSAPQWASTPYDVSGEFVGSPVASAVIMRFVADRAFTFGGTAYFACTSNTGASTATFTVNVAGVSKGTVTIAGNGTSGTGTVTSTSVTLGQTITVVATTPANVVDVWFTLPGLV
jgi:hypothetical protein